MKFPGKGIGWKQFGLALKDEYKRDRVSDSAGALTFFGVLALFPFLLFVMALASVIVDPQQAEKLVNQVSGMAPGAVKDILIARIRSMGSGSNAGLLSVGAIGALWAASGGLVAVSRALNVAYDVEEQRPFWKLRATMLGMTVVVSVLAIVAGVVMVGGGAVASHLPQPFGLLVNILRFPVAFLLMSLLWALVYYVLPDVEQRFKFISPGSLIGVVLWLVASWAFGFYVSNFGKYDATYGALGGVIVMLLWMYISAQMLLIGAEINSLIEHLSPEGKRAGAKDKDDTGVAPASNARGTPTGELAAASTMEQPTPRPRKKKQKRSVKKLATGLAAAWVSEKLGDRHVRH